MLASVENYHFPMSYREFPPEESESDPFGHCAVLYFYLHLRCKASQDYELTTSWTLLAFQGTHY